MVVDGSDSTGTGTAGNPRRPRWALLGCVALVHLVAGVIVWRRGGAAEDSYILFKYADMLARGHGIAFYPGGPPSEGATDFLWMLALAAGAKLGLAPAYTGLVLDTAGMTFVAAVLDRTVATADSPTARRLGLVAILTLPTMPFAVAGILGFGSTAYAALTLALYLAFVERAAWVPPLAVVVALVRPDGAVLAAGFALLQARQMWLARAQRPHPRLLTAWAAAALVGLGYFTWRWHYFGEPLPLPLFVKRHFALPAPGIADMRDWLASTALPALAFVCLVGWLWKVAPRVPRAVVLGVLPFAVHLAMFVHTTPSQNIVNRFEAPSEVLATYLTVLLTVRAAAERSSRFPLADAFVPVGFVLMLVPRWVVVQPEWNQAFERTHYAVEFGRSLGRIANARPPSQPRVRLATTEAGRLAYELDGPVLDLVGLCTAETAKGPPTFALLDAFRPDLLVVHPAGTLDEQRLDGGTRHDLLAVDTPLVPLLWGPYPARAVADFGPYASAPWLGPAPADLVENIRGAPPPVFAWLDRQPGQFTVLVVGIPARYARYHVVAIRRTLPEHDALVAALKNASRPDP